MHFQTVRRSRGQSTRWKLIAARRRRKFILPHKRRRFIFHHDLAVTNRFSVDGVHRILHQTIVADTAVSAAHGGPEEHCALPEGEEIAGFRDAAVPLNLSAVYQAVGAVGATCS